MSTCTTLAVTEPPPTGDCHQLLSSPTIYLDDKGDLRLVVGGDIDDAPQDFVVCSRALGRSSPVLKTMLFGGFAESRPAQDGVEWSVDLPEDGTEPMEIVLNIVHGRFNLVPEKLTLSRLYDVLTITEKYDMTVITRPWARAWMQAVRHQTEDARLLCVAWELGDADVFQELYRKMTVEAQLDMRGRLVYGYSGRVWNTGPERYNFCLDRIMYLRPPGVFETMENNRQKVIYANLQRFIILYRCLKEGCRYMKGYYHSSSDAEECNSMLLGSLMRCLAKGSVDITMPDPCESYRGSVEALEKATAAVKLLTVHRPSAANQCLKRIEEELAKGAVTAAATKSELMVLQAGHREYLEKQARKTGVVLAG